MSLQQLSGFIIMGVFFFFLWFIIIAWSNYYKKLKKKKKRLFDSFLIIEHELDELVQGRI